MSFWAVIAAEAGENMFLNPSAETTGNYAAHNGATVARSNTYARFGVTSYSVTLGAANRGINLTSKALSAVDTYVTFYVYTTGTISGTLQASLNAGANYTAASVIGGKTGGWVRYGALVIAAQVTASGTAGIIRDTADDTLIYVDGAMAQQVGYATTYIDGDQPGCVWSNLYHGSSSTRDAQYRSAGRERDLYDDYAIGVLREFSGVGLPPIANNLHSFALKAGAEFRGTKVLARELTLVPDITGDTWTGLHSKRQDFLNLISPEEKRGEQECVIVYKGAGASESSDKLYGRFRYSGGGEFANAKTFNEQPIIRLTAVDPYWYEDNQSAASLDFQDSITAAAYSLRRVGGQWLALGTGFSSTVDAITADRSTGRIYFGGSFATADGVTVNGITYWNGTTFTAMGGTAGVAGGTARVYAVAVAPNGDVYVGGDFTSAGGATADGLARWNYSSSTWTGFTNGTAGDIIRAIAIDSDGNVYIGGSFLNWDGTANSDYVAKYNGSAWSALGTGMDNIVLALKIGPDGDLYAGGTFTTSGGTTTNYIAKWDGSAWSSMGGMSNTVYSIDFDKSGRMYAAGNFATAGGASVSDVAVYNGSSWAALATGTDGGGPARCISVSDSGMVYLGGDFASLGGLALADGLGIWNGSAWVHLDVDMPGSKYTYAIATLGEDVYIGTPTSGTATVSGITTVTNAGTARAYPRFTIIGPSSSSCRVQWIENQSSGHRLYLNLNVQAGEVVTVDCDMGLIVSNWRGVIGDNPLGASNFTNFRLLPGSNTIAAYITGTTTAAVLLCTWAPRHMSVDGAA